MPASIALARLHLRLVTWKERYEAVALCGRYQGRMGGLQKPLRAGEMASGLSVAC